MRKIIIGDCGTGKSTRCLKEAVDYNGIVIYLDGIPDAGKWYEKNKMNQFIYKNNIRPFKLESTKKYFITPENGSSEIFKTGAELFASDKINDFIGKEILDMPRLVIFDDNAWSFQKNKLANLWKLSHSATDCIISVQDWKDLFGIHINLTLEMYEDLSHYWTIIEMS